MTSHQTLLKGRFIHCLISFSLSLGTLQAQDDRPRVPTAITKESIKADGILDETDWSKSVVINDLLTIVPEQGGIPTGKTEVRIVSNEKFIAFGVRCFDPNPKGIINFSKLRDADLRNEDYLRVIIDPFMDGQSGYIFSVNPNGARYDALVSNRGEGENPDWDGIWEAGTVIDDQGWTVEIVIPVLSINFRKGLREWGFNVERNIQRNLEIIRWANVTRDQWFTQTSRSGIVTDLPDFNYGMGLNVRPAVITRIDKQQSEEIEVGAQPALTLSKRIGANVTATATFNTDFAETEVDTRQTNLTRFPLFFPEKRAFFLEGADIFEYGFGLGRDVIPFFSRRIGLMNGNQIPIVAGGKLNGRLGKTSFGGLAMNTRSERFINQEAGDTLLVPASTMGVFRVKHNILKESSVGFFGSVGDPMNRSGAYVSGVDFTYQTTRFRGNKNFLVGVWGLYNDREGLEGDKSSFGMKIDYPNDIWDVAMTYLRVGDAFDPSIGFVPRQGINRFSVGGTWGPRPKWPLVRQIRNQLFFTMYTDLNYEWQTYRVFTAPINWRFESGERFEFNIMPQGERIVEPFQIAEDVTIPEGAYNFMRYRLEGDIAAKRKLNGRLTWWFGTFYEGDLNEYQATINFNPIPFLTFELSGTRNVASLPFGDFEQNLIGSRIRLNVTPDLQINSFIQYDTESGNFGVNSRIHWIYHPQGDFFIVYNNTSFYQSMEDRLMRVNTQLLLKLRYNFRL